MHRPSGHGPWRELILGYEELDADERRRADAHLAECASCTALLRQVLQVEGATALGALPEAPIELDAPSAAQAALSLRALRARLGLEDAETTAAPTPALAPTPAPASTPAPGPVLRPDSTRRARHEGRWTWPRWPVVVAPLAAAAAVLVTLVMLRAPRPSDEATVRSARIERFSGARGGDATWQSGDAFVLDLDLARASVPVVVHVDPSGAIALLHPHDPAAPARRLPPGRVRLPRPESRIEWRLEGPPGRETLLVTAASGDLDLADVWRAVHAAAERGESRDAVIARVTSVLRARVGGVRSVEIERL